MLVDDSDTDNFINKRVLELSKFTNQILIKNSGRNALEYLNDNENNPEKLPDIIFLDINMPIVDGFVFLYEFEDFSEKIKSHCKIIILSSSNSKKDIDRIIDNKYVVEFLTKPLSLDTVANLKKSNLVKEKNLKPLGGK
ncbi:MAG: response regulator [Cytophagales bacterium]|nr:MAG: response regulator [Cytophagales bacterium]